MEEVGEETIEEILFESAAMKLSSLSAIKQVFN